MSQELHYTSAPQGLKPGSKGFCTVATTPNLPALLAERLESLSGYRPVYPPHDPSASRNPVVVSHVRARLGETSLHIVSRVGFCGLDYTQRSNKYAHHVVLDAAERPVAGPACVALADGFLQSSWDGPPLILPYGRQPTPGDRPPSICTAWQNLTGDAGWAGVLAESFLADPATLVFLVFSPGMDLLPLFVEAIALIPPTRRWEVTFSTYYTTLPQGVICIWRGVVDGSPEAEQARRLPNARFIDLCRPLGRAEGGALVEQARTGITRADFIRPLVAESTDDEIQDDAAWPSTPHPVVHSNPVPRPDFSLLPEIPHQRLPSQAKRPTAIVRPRRKRRIVAAALGLVVLTTVGVAIAWIVRSEIRPSEATRLIRHHKSQSQSKPKSNQKKTDDRSQRNAQLAANRSGSGHHRRESVSPTAPKSQANPEVQSREAQNHATVASKPRNAVASIPPAVPSGPKRHYYQFALPEIPNGGAFGGRPTPPLVLQSFNEPPKSISLMGHAGAKTDVGGTIDFMHDDGGLIVLSKQRGQLNDGAVTAKICRMKVKDGSLMFEWDTAAGTRSWARSFLQDCAVRITDIDGVQHIVLLRELQNRSPVSHLPKLTQIWTRSIRQPLYSGTWDQSNTFKGSHRNVWIRELMIESPSSAKLVRIPPENASVSRNSNGSATIGVGQFRFEFRPNGQNMDIYLKSNFQSLEEAQRMVQQLSQPTPAQIPDGGVAIPAQKLQKKRFHADAKKAPKGKQPVPSHDQTQLKENLDSVRELFMCSFRMTLSVQIDASTIDVANYVIEPAAN